MQLQKILRNPHCYTNNGGLGQTSNIPPGYLVGGLGMGGLMVTGLIALLILRK
tara:strand:+ start:503 stop:661 length:159 start_codon:yes stop_codon:yes gene_type:complete